MNSRLSGADGIRAIACLAVIAHHLWQRLAMPAQAPWLQELQAFALLGNVGVSAFFVLSGFLLAYPFWRRYGAGEAFPSLSQYTLRRAARIVPGYYASLLACAVLTAALAIPTEAFWPRLLAGLTFTAGFHYVTFFPSELNGPLWSIGFEVFCYLLLPLFMWGLFRAGTRSFRKALFYWVGALLLILLLNQAVHAWFTPSEEGRGWQHGSIGGAKYWMPRYNPVGFFGHFAFGILAAGMAQRWGAPSERLQAFRAKGGFDLVSGGSLLLLIVALWLLRHAPEFSFSLQQQPYFFPVVPLLVAVALASAPHSRRIGALLDNRVFRFTAQISFGLYIWHYALITLTSMYLIPAYQYMGIASAGTWIAISLGIAAASLALATASYYIVEAPAIRWAHRRDARGRATTEGAAPSLRG
ncbi:acyltransferase [Paenibacillus sp. TRM 82003]|nr:acyltransferase [Paenibacillus sp. TRM 82003]